MDDMEKLLNFNDTSAASTGIFIEDEDVSQEYHLLQSNFKWTAEPIIKTIICSLIILLAITGNSIVLLAVCLYRKLILKSITNYFITNLAIADLLVSVTVTPYKAILDINNGYWYFGNTYCQIWSLIDVWYCSASILSLCAITIDRYIGVTKPLLYPSLMTRKRAIILIILVWFISFLTSGPPLLIWEEMQHLTSSNQCKQQYNLEHALITCIGTFYIPMGLIIGLYWKIYLVIKGFEKSLLTGRMNNSNSNNNGSGAGDDGSSNGEGMLRVHYGAYNNGVGQQPTPSKTNSKSASSDSSDDEEDDGKSSISSNSTSSGPSSPVKAVLKHQREHTKDQQQQGKQCHCKFRYCKMSPMMTLNLLKFQKHKRTAFHLSFIVGVFIICWFPFFTVLLLRGIGYDFEHKRILTAVFIWLGYLNSGLNPILYMSRSRQFKTAIKKMFCGRRIRKKNGTGTGTDDAEQGTGVTSGLGSAKTALGQQERTVSSSSTVAVQSKCNSPTVSRNDDVVIRF